jgi:response regulator RpfG family c-di-GMP phosphodiesterase
VNNKILCVDDDQDILDGYRRKLRRVFDIETELGGQQGLETISKRGPYAVVVSDMRMPGMNGIQFLSKVRELAPNTVRMMLTGMSDQQTAMDAVNEGSIFRFLTKPCPSETFAKALAAGVRQYGLITAEQELLEDTLKGSIKVLVDILSLTNPAAFSRCMRIRHYAVQIVNALKLTNPWQYEVAAMLSQIGYVTVPLETLEKLFAGETLTESEQEMIKGHPEVARKLIENIPRLEVIAEIIASQNRPVDQARDSKTLKKSPALVGGHILKIAIDFDMLLFGGAMPAKAIEALKKREGQYDPEILRVLEDVKVPTFERTIKSQKIINLMNGSILAEDIHTKTGMLVVTKGQEVNDLLRRRLQNFRLQGKIEETVRVYVTHITSHCHSRPTWPS